MALTVQEIAVNATVSAYLIPQKKGVAMWGAMVGTKNMFNCLGIVIHNAQGSCGVITHVEAQDSEDEYISHTEQAIQKMMIKLNASGGNQGSLEVVTLGNAGGGQGKFGEKLLFVIEKHTGIAATAPRLKRQDLLDLRNRSARGQIGTRSATGLDTDYLALAYDPLNETVWVDNGLKIISIISNNRPNEASPQTDEM